jgi:hypothetical protein
MVLFACKNVKVLRYMDDLFAKTQRPYSFYHISKSFFHTWTCLRLKALFL